MRQRNKAKANPLKICGCTYFLQQSEPAWATVYLPSLSPQPPAPPAPLLALPPRQSEPASAQDCLLFLATVSWLLSYPTEDKIGTEEPKRHCPSQQSLTDRPGDLRVWRKDRKISGLFKHIAVCNDNL